jgi:hypothetical protein
VGNGWQGSLRREASRACPMYGGEMLTLGVPRLGLVAALTCALALTVPSTASAGSVSLNDSARVVMHLSGLGIEGHGTATGTLHASLGLQVKPVSANKLRIRLSIESNGGSFIGRGFGRYRVPKGMPPHFSGTVSIGQGTGRYKHAKGALRISGTIMRSTSTQPETYTVKLSGKLDAEGQRR